MIARCNWCTTFNALEDDEQYTLTDLQEFLAGFGHTVESQAIYRWINRRSIAKRGTVNRPTSSQNLVCWLGADLRNALSEENQQRDSVSTKRRGTSALKSASTRKRTVRKRKS